VLGNVGRVEFMSSVAGSIDGAFDLASLVRTIEIFNLEVVGLVISNKETTFP
jgi:hypothetical protein